MPNSSGYVRGSYLDVRATDLSAARGIPGVIRSRLRRLNFGFPKGTGKPPSAVSCLYIVLT